jgi:AraC-like DNA-binding protein
MNLTPFSWQNEIKGKLRTKSIGDDFILLENFANVPKFLYPFKLEMTVALLCTKGMIRGAIDMHSYDLHAPFSIIVRSGQVLHHEYVSSDFSGFCLVLSDSFALEFLPQIDQPLLIANIIKERPYAQLSEEHIKIGKKYLTTLKKCIAMTENPYRLEIIKYLTMTFFYVLRPKFQSQTENTKLTRQTLLVEQFTNLVRENFRRERDTKFYADRLFFQPQYMSKLIKQATGKSASDWIDDFVMLEAKALLKSTHMTIQQISDKLNFPSQSFFGKYFKRCEGVSPKEYREK